MCQHLVTVWERDKIKSKEAERTGKDGEMEDRWEVMEGLKEKRTNRGRGQRKETSGTGKRSERKEKKRF